MISRKIVDTCLGKDPSKIVLMEQSADSWPTDGWQYLLGAGLHFYQSYCCFIKGCWTRQGTSPESVDLARAGKGQQARH